MGPEYQVTTPGRRRGTKRFPHVVRKKDFSNHGEM